MQARDSNSQLRNNSKKQSGHGSKNTIRQGDKDQKHPIQILVNYWELRSVAMSQRLDELNRQGLNHIASFVPWQAVEADISHSLMRFLQAVAERKMSVSLILTPEVGVNYTNSGVPKDIFSKLDSVAKHVHGKSISIGLPPNIFPLPSLGSPEFTKRYQSFLSRMDTFFADLTRTQPEVLDRVTAVLTGSFWKYYRAAESSTGGDVYTGATGDYSSSTAVVYRQKVEQFYSQKEFFDANQTTLNQWKTRALEGVNRRWFYQQSEDVFRNRSVQCLRKKAASLNVEQYELYTPEADPSLSYLSFFQEISGKKANFQRLSSLVDSSALRMSAGGKDPSQPYIHWTSLGGFRTLSDSEKQFLILKSLLLVGSQGGGVLMDEAEWFGLSSSFRTRAETLARLLAEGELKLKTRALYFTPHLWSGASTLWDLIRPRLGPHARMISSLDLLAQDQEAALIMVDPKSVIHQDVLDHLMQAAKLGKVVAIPRSSLYSDVARAKLEESLGSTKGIQMNLGISYRIHTMGEGKVVLYDLPDEYSQKSEIHGAWGTFLSSVLSLAGVQGYCSLSDSRLRAFGLERKSGGMGMFILNPSSKPISADLLFTSEVSVSDLSSTFSSKPRPQQPGTMPANRFALEVPPFGILPIAVNGLEDAEERRKAATSSEILKTSVMESAANELAGYNESGPGIEAIWN